jgi:hypothetical protein
MNGEIKSRKRGAAASQRPEEEYENEIEGSAARSSKNSPTHTDMKMCGAHSQPKRHFENFS